MDPLSLPGSIRDGIKAHRMFSQGLIILIQNSTHANPQTKLTLQKNIFAMLSEASVTIVCNLKPPSFMSASFCARCFTLKWQKIEFLVNHFSCHLLSEAPISQTLPFLERSNCQSFVRAENVSRMSTEKNITSGKTFNDT